MAAPALPPIDPALMALAWEILAERSERSRKGVDSVQVAVTAWHEYKDAALTAEAAERMADAEISDAELEHDIRMVGLVAQRLTALADVLARLEPGSYPVALLVEIAAVAPLVGPDERPSFQLLDFLARAGPAAGGTR